MLKRLNQTGDTIVEVIIVLAVIGLALSISYATANSSLKATRQAEENSQATAILQGQIETLRAYSAMPSSDTSHYVYTTTPYCIYSGAVTPATDAHCTFNNLFAVTISYDSTTDNFTSKAVWDDVSGNGQDTVTMIYRMHK